MGIGWAVIPSVDAKVRFDFIVMGLIEIRDVICKQFGNNHSNPYIFVNALAASWKAAKVN